MKNYILQKENSIEETKKQLELILKVRKEQKEIIECAGGWCVNCDPDIKALTESIYILKDYKKVLKEVKRLENMYEAEHRIHLLRNEQLDRKQKAIIKCNELENENEELKKEIKSWKKYSDEQEENIIEKNNIICNLEFQNAELKNEHSCLINRIENKIDKLDYEMEGAKRRNDQERANYCWDFLINFTNLLESEE